MSIEKFATDILDYGYAMKLNVMVGSTSLMIGQDKMVPIHHQTGSKSLKEFLTDVVRDTGAKELRATVSKRNGSAFIDPREFKIEINPAEFVKPEVSKAVDKMDEAVANLGNLPGSTNHLIDWYKLQAQQANDELKRAKDANSKLQDKFDALKEKHSTLEKDHATIDQKHALERERERIAGENTLASVMREFKPEIHQLANAFSKKNGNGVAGPPEQANPSLSSVMLKTFADLPEILRVETYELFTRYFNVTPEDRAAIISDLRVKTESLTAQLNDQIAQLDKR
jgi:hypothetical protein